MEMPGTEHGPSMHVAHVLDHCAMALPTVTLTSHSWEMRQFSINEQLFFSNWFLAGIQGGLHGTSLPIVFSRQPYTVGWDEREWLAQRHAESFMACWLPVAGRGEQLRRSPAAAFMSCMCSSLGTSGWPLCNAECWVTCKSRSFRMFLCS